MVGQGAGGWVCEAQARSVAVKPKASGFVSIKGGGKQIANLPRGREKSAPNGVTRLTESLIFGVKDIAALRCTASPSAHCCCSLLRVSCAPRFRPALCVSCSNIGAVRRPAVHRSGVPRYTLRSCFPNPSRVL